ncbi:MAG: IclR family transcriptional regulator [Pseudomonadota bacterium]
MANKSAVQDQTRYVVGAVDSALDVLEIVAREPGSSLVEVSKRADLNKSRTMRFLVTLELRGYVRKDLAGNYHLASKAVILGDHARAQMGQLQLLQPILDRLRDETSETVQYRILDGLQSVCLAKADSPLDIRVHTETGRPRELYIGSSKSILAFGGEDLLNRVLSSPRAHYTENTLVDDNDLRRQLAEIRKQGYSVSNSERIEGAIAIGAPIINADQSVTSCLSLLGPEFRIKKDIDLLAKRLVAAATEVRDVLT